MALDFVAGCIGGSTGVIVGYPLDTVKTHLQVQDGNNPKYRGTFHCFKSILVKDGVRGLYRGVTSPLVGLAAINALVFGVYGTTMKYLESDSLQSVVIAGSVSGIVQSFICAPTELVKSRLQVLYTGSNIKTLDYVKQLFVKEGVKGLYRGLNITIVREVPGFASYFGTYEYLVRTPDNSPASTGRMLWAGGIAGMVSWFCVYPVDVIKTRMQLDGVDGTKYKHSFDCIRKSVQSEGVGSLFRGLSPTLIRAFPVNACTFTAVTWTLHLFGEDGFFKRANTPRESDSLWDAIPRVKVMDPA